MPFFIPRIAKSCWCFDKFCMPCKANVLEFKCVFLTVKKLHKHAEINKKIRLTFPHINLGVIFQLLFYFWSSLSDLVEKYARRMSNKRKKSLFLKTFKVFIPQRNQI